MDISLFEATLPKYCTPTSQFLIKTSIYFHTCIPTPLAFTSTLLGGLSILSWLFAQMPQIYKNHQLQSTAGLSIFFLGEWLLGDATNLVGALLTGQASWQVVVASYYVFVDVCLVIQFFWYTHIKPWKEGRALHSSGSSMMSDNSDIINGLSPINTSFVEDIREPEEVQAPPKQDQSPTKPINTPRFSQVSYEKSTTFSGATPVHVQVGPGWIASPSPRTMLYVAAVCALISTTTATPVPENSNVGLMAGPSTSGVIGTILSWCSTVLYLGSRLPQLYKNWRRRSTAGLSPLLFFAAFCGNTFYSTSLLTSPFAWSDFEPHGGHGWAGPEGSKRGPWVASAAPFFLGAAGVLALDALMGVQFVLYGERDEEKLVKVRGPHGRSRWQRVSGWMRGWVPSVKEEKKLPLAESEALLRSSRELDRHMYGAIE